MNRKVIHVLLLGLLVSMIVLFVGCGGNSSESDSINENSLLANKTALFYQYSATNDIELTYFPERKTVANWVDYIEIQSLFEQGINVREGFSLSSEIINYVQTENNSDWVYYGELKDDKPEGLGIIFEKNDFFEMDSIIIKYIGYFKDGKYDGYGVEFNCPSINDHMYYTLTANSFLEENRYLLNDVIYEGYYEKGKKQGKGIEVYSNAGGVVLETGHIFSLPEEIKYDILIGDFKKNETKECNIYSDGKLVFEGNFEDVEDWYYENY